MKHFFSIFLAVVLLAFGSCRESVRDMDTGTDDSQDMWVATNQMSNIIREFHRVVVVDSILNNVDSADALFPANCIDTFTRTPDTGPFPINLQIVYSDSVECEGDRTKTGRINVSMTGYYANFGTQIKITPDSFSMAGVYFKGDIDMVLIGKTPDSLLFQVHVLEAEIIDTKKAGNNVSRFSGIFTWLWYRGRLTVSSLDDQFIFFGDGNGLARNGVYYDFFNSDWCYLNSDCEYEGQGGFTLKSNNRENRILNFGNGNCDNKMVVSIPPVNGDYEVSIP